DIIGDFTMPLVKKGQDTATWLMILRNQDYAYGIEEALVNYRIVGNSLSSNKIKALKRTWNTYRNVENIGFLKSSYVFCFYVYNAIKKRI
ncbi:glycosyltransferase family 2 protein, partial [Clostridium tertium]